MILPLLLGHPDKQFITREQANCTSSNYFVSLNPVSEIRGQDHT